MRKAEVQIHCDQGRCKPAVNVKIYNLRLEQALTLFQSQNAREDGITAFTLDWVEQLSADVRDDWWHAACDRGWEQLEEDVNAENVFGRKVTIYSEGRSGGWAIVDGMTAAEVEHWDAVALARWAKFVRYCRETTADVPYQYLDLIFYNRFQPEYLAQQGRADLTQRMAL